jgi:hypothetical protein
VKVLQKRHKGLKRYFISPDGRSTAVWVNKRTGDHWWTTYAHNGRIDGGSTEGYRSLAACLKNYHKPQPVHVFGVLEGAV